MQRQRNTRVVAVRMKQRDDGLGVDVLRVIGYRAVCDRCDRFGVVRSDYSTAQLDAREHACPR